ncbi:putative nuclease HARBI1 [Scylla paramamosain]|uniref:putative nuclease HARBI1 n=1 Tax=Scylla paramamosain TaxID=85552 RepID=UPI00308378B5
MPGLTQGHLSKFAPSSDLPSHQGPDPRNGYYQPPAAKWYPRTHKRTYASVSRVFECVCIVLSDKSVQEIKMPSTHLDQRRTAQQFFRIKNFLRVIGTIDGTHIAIKARRVDEALYFNWKSYHSL